MAVCTFFGHRDCPETIKPYLREVLIDLINNQEVDTFYVGNRGGSMESCAVSCGNWQGIPGDPLCCGAGLSAGKEKRIR